MRFQCDRCNTRYSIGDERVRGKILKVRCKTCSAVITVCEGMDEEYLVQPHDLARRSRGDGHDAAADPAASRDEWYISLRGQQDGPLSLIEAIRRVARYPADADLYCWHEGMSDWLSVENVVELRGLRKPAVLPAPPSGRPPADTAKAARASTTLAPSLVPSTGRAGGAGQSSGARLPGRKAELPDALATRPGLMDQGMSMGHGRGGPGTSTVPADPSELFAPAPATRAAPGGGLFGAPASGAAAQARNGGSSDQQTTWPGPAAAPGQASALSAMTEDSNLDLDIDEPSRIVNLAMLVPRPAPGEAAAGANRARQSPAMAPGGVPMPMTGGGGAITALTALGPGRGTAALPVLGMPAGNTDPAGGAAAPRRRSMLPLLLGAFGVLGIAAAALAFVVMRGSGDNQDGTLAAGRKTGSFENLGYRVEDPGRASRGSDSKAGSSGGGDQDTLITTRIDRKSRSDRGSAGSSGMSRTAETESKQQASDPASSDPGTLLPFNPDDIVRKSGTTQLGFQRCYERAKRKDPFLDVKTIKVSLKVSSAGQISSVRLSSHDSDDLGSCLKSRIGAWKFEPSRAGISTELSLAFEQH